MQASEPAAELWIWRHPRAREAHGRCIGRTDLAVNARRAKRLAHRIRAIARREGLPREVWTSPLRRSADVGQWLRRWGWRHHVDARLAELDFGTWDGLPWSEIAPGAFKNWEADFLHHRVGGGESLALLLARAEQFAHECSAGEKRLVVSHGGWINAAVWLASATDAQWSAPKASLWPAAPAHASLTRLQLQLRNGDR